MLKILKNLFSKEKSGGLFIDDEKIQFIELEIDKKNMYPTYWFEKKFNSESNKEKMLLFFKKIKEKIKNKKINFFSENLKNEKEVLENLKIAGFEINQIKIEERINFLTSGKIKYENWEKKINEINPWKNILDFNFKIPKMLKKDSQKFFLTIATALPNKKFLKNNDILISTKITFWKKIKKEFQKSILGWFWKKGKNKKIIKIKRKKFLPKPKIKIFLPKPKKKNKKK